MNDEIRLQGIRRGIARGGKIRAEIEERRPKIRAAADLAEKLVAYAGSEMLVDPVQHFHPGTTAGIAAARARRIQLRERSEVRR